jgi:acyl-CoA thioester hydrolase
MTELARIPPDPAERVSAIFRHIIFAADSDVDMMGHVSNVAYVRWVQDVALAHSTAVGWDMNRYFELGAAFLVRRHEVDYLRQAYAGDGIEVSTWIAKWTAATSIRRTAIVRIGDQVELARASTTWALVVRDSGRPRRIPREIQQAFAPG